MILRPRSSGGGTAYIAVPGYQEILLQTFYGRDSSKLV